MSDDFVFANRKLPGFEFELSSIWKHAKPGRKFWIRPLSAMAEKKAVAKGEKLCRDSKLEHPEVRNNMLAGFVLFAACSGDEAGGVPVMQDAESLINALTVDELTKLSAIYTEIKRVHSPFHLDGIRQENIDAIVTTCRERPDAVQEELLEWKQEQLTEIIVRLCIDSERYLNKPEPEAPGDDV